MKKKTSKEKKIENLMVIIGLCFVSIMLLFMFYLLIIYSINDYPLERAAKKIVKDNEEYCTSHIINETRGAACINYNCVHTTSNRITEGIKECKGKYYIFFDRIGDKWVVNESSKVVIW